MGLFRGLFGTKKNKDNGKAVSTENLLEDVEVLPGVVLPNILSEYWPILQEAKRSSIHIAATPTEKLTLQQSKFFHFPCIPSGFSYPVDRTGKYMIPLAQINFSECPALNGFPASGYLQFYIADNDIYGLDFDDQQTQNDFRVLYFKEEEVTDPHQDFSFLSETMNTENSPVDKPYHLTFQIKDEYIGIQDYHGDQLIKPIIDGIVQKHPAIKDSLMDILYDRFTNPGHKLGGYAYFTQEDPRQYKEQWRDHLLLFQLDSDNDIMWGDVGIANFFIRPEDLAQLNFTNIIYNWDCH